MIRESLKKTTELHKISFVDCTFSGERKIDRYNRIFVGKRVEEFQKWKVWKSLLLCIQILVKLL